MVADLLRTSETNVNECVKSPLNGLSPEVEGMNALHLAVLACRLSVVEMCFEHGALVNLEVRIR